MTRLRIALLDSWRAAAAEGSGTAVVVRGLAGELRARGHDVAVIRPPPRDPLPARRIRHNLRLPGILRRGALRDGPWDLVVGVDLDGFALPRRRRFPYVVTLKGVARDEARHERGFGRLERSLASLLEGRNARRADRVVVCSAHSARAAVESYGLDPRRVVVVPEGLDEERRRVLSARRAARPPGHTVLSVARQYRRKNTVALLRALPRVARAVPGVRLRVVGGGPELPRLRREARRLGVDGRVVFTGAVVSDEEVWREYGRADCFCLPSRQESFGLVFLEAMAAGLPVVAPDRAAVPEVVGRDGTALLVDPDDPDAVADALVRALTDEPLRRRLAARARRRAGALTLERSVDRFLEVVAPLLRRRAGSAIPSPSAPAPSP